ncbi:uncharacterized protein I303_107445 [Kwoniella dejecticola CBS 10117]|uniref:Mog1p/PsbP-like protein n=1 Tax=Kwoniella dejecticola CBS 10117 TaxID=1296121 RepID=A0A1A5ZZP7_9TREE|nr:uncharacterized protein I303_06849 [Kwoniella dejecticola CBS 10117]OBR83286.1 hypothetical protein I303_06849 [Kwoniella dejecticola CBS 10117]
MSSSLSTRPLFGGAIDLDLPREYLDASDLRQIPDNQEVFLSSTSDTAIVLEVLGMVEEGQAGVDLWEAAKFHFSSIAHDNASLESTILTTPPSAPIPSGPATASASASATINGEQPVNPEATTISGTQVIHKFSHNPTGAPREGHEDDTPDTVWIGVGLWRIWFEDQSTQTKMKKKADLVLSVNVNLSAEGGTGTQEREKVESWFFDHCVKSLKIRDFGLFGDSQ